MHPHRWRSTLRAIAILGFLVSIIWLAEEPGFEPLIALLTATAALLGLFVGSDVPVRIPLTRSPQAQQELYRAKMLEKVETIWIKGVLKDSLHGAVLLRLGMEYRPEAVKQPWDLKVQRPDAPDRILPPEKRISDVFEEMGGELLILGEPGSGKTTMLLELAQDLITTAKQPLHDAPIPVVLTLSSWEGEQQTIEDWLVSELDSKYQVPKNIGIDWVETDQLLLLLDGLDELDEDHRGACVEAINSFRQRHGLVRLVVCSRTADYEALATRLQLLGAVVTQPLNPTQIDTYLVSLGKALENVQSMMRHDAMLKELAKSPLMLSIIALAYLGMPGELTPSLQSVESWHKHLFDTYVLRMFRHRRRDRRHTPQQAVRWLVWLAQKMTDHSQSIFLIEHMQPTWLESHIQQWVYEVTPALVLGLPLLYAGLNIRSSESMLSGSSPEIPVKVAA